MRDWRALVRERHAGARVDADVLVELADYAEARYGELRARGVAEAEALASALAEVGAVEGKRIRRRRGRLSESSAAIGAAGGRGIMHGFWQDVRVTLRVMRLNPGFALGALFTLLLGLGGAIAMFTIINGVLLRPLPYPSPERLLRLVSVADGEQRRTSALDFLDWKREATASFERMGLTIATNVIVVDESGAERMAGEVMDEHMLPVLGARAQFGRLFRAEDTQPGAAPVTVLSHAIWQRRFGGREDVIGQRLRIEGVDNEIIGVLPADFRFLQRQPDIFQALTYEGSIVREDNRGLRQWEVFARMKPGVDVAAANAELERVAAELALRWPDSNANQTAAAIPLREHLVADARGPLLLLFAAVGFMLVIASTNLLNLLLTRATRREGEIAIRLALGASRGRVVRQMLVEAGVLSCIGALLGLGLAAVVLRVLPAFAADRLPRLHDVAIDGRVFAFAAGVALLSTLLIGLLPAVRASGARAGAGIRNATRGTGGARGSQAVRNILMTVEVACAVLLVAAAGVLVRSLVQLQTMDPGFETANVSLFDISTAEPDFVQRGEFYARLLGALRAEPGVEAAGATFQVPMSGTNMITTLIEPSFAGASGVDRPSIAVRVITPGFLQALSIPLVRGRDFTDADRAGSARVVLINEETARRHWPDVDPLGKRIELDLGMGGQLWGGTVIGVVANIRHVSPAEGVGPEVYVPQTQGPVEAMTVVVRGVLGPQAVADVARRHLERIEPYAPISGVTTLDRVVASATATPRFYSLLIGLFAVISLLLAAVGVYSIVAFGVQQRTREFGIRIALGAQPGSLVADVLSRTLRFLLVGVLIGAGAFLAIGRVLSSLTHDVRLNDPVYLFAVAVALLLVGALASAIPAWRSTRVDPVAVINTA